jgi:hypothetical protein
MSHTITPIRFGFLPHKGVIEYEFGKIVPTPEFDQIAKAIKKRLHEDGHFYPPIVDHPIVLGKTAKAVQNTKRPAHLYGLPASHDLCVSLTRAEPNIREGSAGFIIHLLAFLFRTRLQFADWFSDGRIPIDFNGTFALVRNPIQAGTCLSGAYKVWLKWSELQQRRFTNILYMRSRVSAYEWDWEQFILEYMILDACWKMGAELFGLKARDHADRVHVLCKAMSIDLGQLGIDVKTMSDLRNDLFHEALWYKSRPGSVGRRRFYIHAAMGGLNQRLISALIGRVEI